MIRKKITSYLSYEGFRFLNIEGNSLDISYNERYGELFIISLWDETLDKTFDNERFVEEINGVKQLFLDRGYFNISMLNLLITKEPEKAKSFASNGDGHWIIDTVDNRLVIYENQVKDYWGLRHIIAGFLEEGRPAKIKTVELEYGSITMINTIIIIINVLVFITAHSMSLDKKIVQAGGASWYMVKNHGQYYRAITSVFIHSNIGHLFSNMFILFAVGDNLERAVGKVKYTIIYLTTGLFASAFSMIYNMVRGHRAVSIGASGAIFGVVGAMIYILISHKGSLEDLSIGRVVLFAAYGIYGGFTSTGVDNIAHLAGLVGGFLLAWIMYRHKEKKVE